MAIEFFRSRGVALVLVVALLAALFLAGAAVSVRFNNNGPSVRGEGVYVGTTNLAYWTQLGTFARQVPNPVPARVSTTVGAPTVLPGAGTIYMLNGGAASGDNDVRFDFQEATSAPVSHEIEITFTIDAGLGGAPTVVTAYIETQASAPGSPITFTFLYDLGFGTPGSLEVSTFKQVTQSCTAIGTCP